MVRHPHFTQPVFVRFPRPPVLGGPEGVRKFPPADDVPFEDAVARQLVALDRRLPVPDIKDAIAGRREEDVRRALLATRRSHPEDPFAFFRAALGPEVRRERVSSPEARGAPLRSVEDPYAS
jgi:hypothetical protein